METTGHKQRVAIQEWIKANGRRPSWEELDTILEKALPRSRRTKSGFIPPTPQEVSEYGVEIGYRLDGEDFCDSYEKKDWKISDSVKMSSWKAAVRQWKKRGWGILLREDGSSSLVEVPGWRFYLKERQAQGLYNAAIPETWAQLTRAVQQAICGNRKYVVDLNDFATRNPAAFAERLKRMEEGAA